MAVDSVVEQWRRERPDIDAWPIAVVGRVTRLSRFWDAEIKAWLGTGWSRGSSMCCRRCVAPAPRTS